jgi:hypothetical protein
MRRIVILLAALLFVSFFYSCTKCRNPVAYNYNWPDSKTTTCAFSNVVFYTQVLSATYGRSNIYPLKVYLNGSTYIGEIDSAALVVPNSCAFPATQPYPVVYLPYALADSTSYSWRAVSNDPTIVFTGSVQANQAQCIAISIQ